MAGTLMSPSRPTTGQGTEAGKKARTEEKMKKKKSIHELCKEFPNKSYRELEKYRDSDRWEEAIGIGHNHPPKDEEDENKT